MQNQDNIRPTFTTIYHDKRIELGLNLLDYVLLDTVFILSQNSRGYCYKSIRALARDLDLSVGGIHKALKRLSNRELLIEADGGYKCSDAFIEAVYLHRSQSEQPQKIVHKVNASDRKVNASVHFVNPQQMLDIHENNNRKAHGAARLLPRAPEQGKPLSEATKRLQQRLNEIREQQKDDDAA